MRSTTFNLVLAGCFIAIGSIAHAQSPITSLSLNADKIGVIKSAPEITTRISFAEPVKEIICGDLYDSGTGKGGFVVQKSDKDVFLKPVATRGISNLFVKTGESGEHIFNFDLEIVASAMAYRVVNVAADGSGSGRSQKATSEGSQTQTKQQSEEILRSARKQADEILQTANKQAEDLTRQARENADQILKQASENGEKQIERSFAEAVLTGIGEAKASYAHSVSRNVAISVDRRLLTFNGKSYMQYVIQNNSGVDFAYTAVSLLITSGDEIKTIPADVFQTKSENRVNKGERLGGVAVFESKLVGPKDKLSMSLRGDDNAELARVIVMK